MTFAIRRALFSAMCVLVLPGIARAQRLPVLAVPVHYELRFAPDLAGEVFAGETTIELNVLRPTDRIVLNAAELEFERVQARAGGREQEGQVSLDVPTETAVLRFPQELPAGKAELRLRYRGHLNRQLRGFYISEANGRKYAVTQLEATSARRMFPSFDEPEYKATFDITAVVDGGDYAISNGPVESIEPGPSASQHTFRFGTTAKMSTYLVALAVGDFECVERTAADTPLRVCATPGKQKLTSYALDVTAAMLEYFNKYFSIRYPFGKLDQVAIPDFAAGAMENTGAIFYRESILLVDPATAPIGAQAEAAVVIAHEMAHHWFGDLVTMRWWDDIWLNEGFATWMSTKAVGAWKPEWNTRLGELKSVQNAMGIDALKSTRPVKVNAETPAEIDELFDPIAYDKAGAILTMVEAYVGEQSFRGAVNGYLAQHQYSNATASDFWTIATRATGKPVDRIMSSFVTQPGLPVVNVSAPCQNGRGELDLAQQRFMFSQEAGSSSESWTVPVCMRVPTSGTDGGDVHCELLDGPNAQRPLDRCASGLVGNAGGEGYYRTAYDAPLRRAFATGEVALEPDEAITVLSDEWSMMRAGRHDVGAFLDLAGAQALRATNAEVVESIASRLVFVHDYLTTAESREAFETWVRGRFGPVLERAKPAAAPGTDSELRTRAALMEILGTAGRDPDLLARAREAVDEYLTGSPAAVDPTLLDAFVTLAAIDGDQALYESYLERSRTAPTPDEQRRFLKGLTEFRDPQLLRRTIDYAFSDAVRTQDRGLLLGAILINPAGRDLAWTRLKEQWDDVVRSLASFGGTVQIMYGLGAFCSTAQADDIRRFFSAHPVPGAERTLSQTLEKIENCAATATAQQPQLATWLASAGSHTRR